MRFDLFLSKIEDIAFLKKYSERVNTLRGITFESLIHLPYQTLKHTIPNLMDEKKYEEVILEVLKSKKKNTKLRHVKRIDNYLKIKFIFWMQDQYGAIANLEDRMLTSTPDAKLVNAGIRELDKLGDDNLIDALAQGKIWLHEKIRQMPYEKIFDKQLKTVIETRIQRELAKQKN